MTLIFDTETTGIIQKRLPAHDPSQPHIVSIAAVLLNGGLREYSCMDVIIKPDGWTIPEDAVKVHGITDEIANQYGVPIGPVLTLFNHLCFKADVLVAYNAAFDTEVIKSELARKGREHYLHDEKLRCCMLECAQELKLPNTRGYGDYKWPKLEESYKFFFGEDMQNAHNALWDVRNTAKIWKHLHP